ncbi:MAG: serine hydrolase domain-containing protein, partial [Actinomycetota bacterium]
MGRVLVALLSATLIAAACGSTDDDAGTDADATPSVVVDAAFLDEQVALSWDPDIEGAVLAVVHDADGSSVWSAAGTAPDGSSPTLDTPVRVGSITKFFTAVLVLDLVDDGLFELTDSAADLLTRVSLDPAISVRDLLRHSSGLPDSTEFGDFLGSLDEEPERVWQPEEVLASVEDEPLAFAPGSSIAYSNNNYTVLGMLIEEVTGSTYAEVLRERISEPLGLSSTYLPPFETGPAPFGGFEGGTFGGTTVVAAIEEP